MNTFTEEDRQKLEIQKLERTLSQLLEEKEGLERRIKELQIYIKKHKV